MAKLIHCQVEDTAPSLDTPLRLYRNALATRPVGHPDHPSTLIHLATVHFVQFRSLRARNEKAQAEAFLYRAMGFSPTESHEHRAATFMLQLLTLCTIDSVELHGQSSPEDLTSDLADQDLLFLGVRLLDDFERFGDLANLQRAVTILEESVRFIPTWDHQYCVGLGNLAKGLSYRFRHLGELSDLESAISMQKRATDLIPHDHPDKPSHLNDLGASLAIRFERLGQLSNLEEAISILRDAVDLTPQSDPDKSHHLHNLGTALFVRFQHVGQLSDLEDAIARHGDAVELIPHDHLNKPTYLESLGTCLAVRFERLGELSDLEDAILMQKSAVDLIPLGHPDRPRCLNSLGGSLLARFQRFGQMNDIEDAISMHRNAVNLIPHGHPGKPGYLHNLGIALGNRFSRLQELSDIEDAISMLVDAVDLTPHGHPDRPGHLDSLGSFLETRYKVLGHLSDIETAVSMHRRAVDLTPDGNAQKYVRVAHLGDALIARSNHFQQMINLNFGITLERIDDLFDLTDAIARFRDGVDLTPHGHPDKPLHLFRLAESFRVRYKRIPQPGDLERAISLYSHAASAPVGPVDVRFGAALLWISCACHIRHQSLLHAHSTAISLLPQLAWIGLSLTDRYSELTPAADVVREAAAAALDSGAPELAVEWLEQGRSIVWGGLLQLRSTYEELASVYPDHARRLQELSTALDLAGATHEQSLSAHSKQAQPVAHESTESPQEVANKHRRLAIERDKLLQEIRKLPGFKNFLTRKKFSQLRASAHSGPVVILNAAESRCDALIVLADLDHVIHVPLPKFNFKRAVDLRTTMKGFVRNARYGMSVTQDAIGWESILPPLWKSVVKPVLDALAFLPSSELSRIFWCPTGPFVFLPIHAAGFYDRQYSEPGHKVFDFLVSSYIPTLAVLAPSPHSVVHNDNLRLLAVPQPSSNGQPRLPGVVTELEYIRMVIGNSPSTRITLEESSVGTVEEVISLMKHADWVHFACHGVQDDVDSGLCLADGRRLKLRDIIALSRPRGGLAFLSACQTAMGEKHLCDEAIHIAAGMLFAGYGGVVGTMWSISDRLAPIVARDVYDYLFRNSTQPDYRDAARALHEAITDLRDRGDVPFSEWVPFIHVGL